MDNIIIYNTDDGAAKVTLYANDGTVWLTQAQMAELFQCTRPNINAHLQAIYKDNELIEQATCKKFLQVQQEGHREVKRHIPFYSLDAILAVGFRVRSSRGIQFRRRRKKQDAIQADRDDMLALEESEKTVKGRTHRSAPLL